MLRKIPTTTKVSICTALVCLAIGFGWSDISKLVGGNYSYRGHDVWRRWVGKDTSQITKELGPPASKIPSDEQIKFGSSRGVLYQRWTYKTPELSFEVRLADNRVTEAYGDINIQLAHF